MTGTEDRNGDGNVAATRLLVDLRIEIARADSKAALLVSAFGLAAGALSAQLAGRHWQPALLSRPGQTVWWSGAAALAMALLALLLAVLPRSISAEWQAGVPLSYFGDIRSADRQGRLDEALSSTDADPGAALRASLAANSRIAFRKHQWIRVGLLTFSASALLLPTALLIG
ncbi:Pycsar system effector family protein [Streptomyces sp. NPDC089795]|uniref:Pycsar system effector family protein n=1 Tax=Streptomyces sp. NPDC089795 TaxID=3155297 RepID=UPI00341B6237